MKMTYENSPSNFVKHDEKDLLTKILNSLCKYQMKKKKRKNPMFLLSITVFFDLIYYKLFQSHINEPTITICR